MGIKRETTKAPKKKSNKKPTKKPAKKSAKKIVKKGDNNRVKKTATKARSKETLGLNYG